MSSSSSSSGASSSSSASVGVFVVPRIYDNPDGGWGPSSTSLKSATAFAPFNKSERLGRIADWNSNQSYHQQRSHQRYQRGGPGSQSTQEQELEASLSAFNYYDEDSLDGGDGDGESFELVDLGKQKSFQSFRQRQFSSHNRWNSSYRRREREQRQAAEKRGGNAQSHRAQQQPRRRRFRRTGGGGFRRWNRDQHKPLRDASIDVQKTWKLVSTYKFPDIAKRTATSLPPSKTLFVAGSLQYIDSTLSRVSTRSKRTLSSTEASFYNVTTSDDPIIEELADKSDARVFGTDVILGVLMAAIRSVYSWDLIITREDDKVFFDKRDESQIDLVTVCETSPEPPSDDGDDKSINSVESLSEEATLINQAFSQMVIDSSSPVVEGDRKNPFLSDGETAASLAYRYREIEILPGVKMLVRCEVSALAKGAGGRVAYTNVKALNEHDDKQWDATPYRTHLDRQRGAVLATELKHNSNKLARWACEALLADVDQVNVGYVSRNNFTSNKTHSLLAVQAFQPQELATQINMDVRRAWGLLQYFVEECLALPEGKYMMLKDPNAQLIRIFSVPADEDTK
mmetsp:Transcript_11515/g.35216  ORF Transcript_11515/g.35216 Transcript_11515/m.35216 type:complete len:570 (+) Transcript_11515:168-1877(+)|eukprot:CAMPEP_0177647490 /NCGR_PEP_ID=MMETSP0447-20121125/10325_1 /TAXON_ID=0 /ORGANISM="Stygamoeba regulata, Strain BSH-02190019" /LENGTH=569 /DNA_ID=CAMNT_0019150073 /DNA_START=157 /DNA_END=1866 /DNA_ORIENTATION=-